MANKKQIKILKTSGTIWTALISHNMKKKTKDFIFTSLITALLMLLCFALIDLYVPIKQVILGDFDSNMNFISYINLERELPIIIAVSIAIAYNKSREKVKTSSR